MNERHVLEIPLDKPWSERLRFFDEHPELMIAEQLGNLHMYLPGAIHRESLSESQLDATPSKNAYFSEKRLGETQREFLNELDRAINDAGIDISKLTELERSKDLASLEDRPNAEMKKAIHEMVLPVYLLLREHGYNTYDITK